jgi:hypothetical protein
MKVDRLIDRDAPRTFKGTREEWLERVTDLLRPVFVEAGKPLPDAIKMSCGFTSKGARGKRIGECWASEASAGNVPEIYIVPRMADSFQVGAILAHELVHATGIMNHGAEFRRVALAIGLAGKMTSTHAGDKMLAILAGIIGEIGEYPHAILSGNTGKKQSTRLLKVECECGYIARVTAKWLESVGAPICPCDGETQMRVA